MTTNKEANNINTISPAHECCMCGDYGFSNELFQCRVCHFRSQHRYCSNLYPEAESYQVCNWCLTKSDEIDKSTNSSNKKTANANGDQESEDDHGQSQINYKKIILMKTQISTDHHNNLQLQQVFIKNNNKAINIKKQRPSSPPPPPSSPKTRKRIITNGALEEKQKQQQQLLKRTKSEELSNNVNNNNNNIIRRPVFRNKVRRYKLLDEVSS